MSATMNVSKITKAVVSAGISSPREIVSFTLGYTKAQNEDPKSAASPQVKLYSNKICPFAQRAWIAILEKQIPFEFVKIPLSGEIMKIKNSGTTKGTQWEDLSGEDVKKLKEDYMKTINHTGEVPTLVRQGEDPVPESDVVAWYLDEQYPTRGSSLIPRKNPRAMAKMLLLNKVIGGGLIAACYGLLKNQDPTKDTAYAAKIHAGLEKLLRFADSSGPFLLGDTFSLADILILPFYERMSVLLPHYRGIDLIPSGAPFEGRMKRWAKACTSRESFKKTSQPPEYYVAAYTGYAGARGRSKPE